MGIACECGFYNDYAWMYEPPTDFIQLNTKRARRCLCCKTLIKVGDDCGKFDRTRGPKDDIEERIHGDEVVLPPVYLCEECFGLYLSVTELGFCVDLEERPMRDMVREYMVEEKGA